jgi:hypothetical protein
MEDTRRAVSAEIYLQRPFTALLGEAPWAVRARPIACLRDDNEGMVMKD